MVKKPILAANWKMYVEKPEAAKKFAAALKRRSQLLSKADIIIAPAFTLLPSFSAAMGKSKSVRLAAQTLSPFGDPQHTGDISAVMLKALGVSTVIIGHSERRAAGETDERVRDELRAAHGVNLTAILCVGESQRDPTGSHFSFVENQLHEALKGAKPGRLLVAYEPVWAIGKSAADAMQPHELEEMAIFIRKVLVDILGRQAGLKVPILYGGSVEAGNAAALMQEGGVNGFLVGHASAQADTFLDILKACLP